MPAEDPNKYTGEKFVTYLRSQNREADVEKRLFSKQDLVNLLVKKHPKIQDARNYPSISRLFSKFSITLKNDNTYKKLCQKITRLSHPDSYNPGVSLAEKALLKDWLEYINFAKIVLNPWHATDANLSIIDGLGQLLDGITQLNQESNEFLVFWTALRWQAAANQEAMNIAPLIKKTCEKGCLVLFKAFEHYYIRDPIINLAQYALEPVNGVTNPVLRYIAESAVVNSPAALSPAMKRVLEVQQKLRAQPEGSYDEDYWKESPKLESPYQPRRKGQNISEEQSQTLSGEGYTNYLFNQMSVARGTKKKFYQTLHQKRHVGEVNIIDWLVEQPSERIAEDPDQLFATILDDHKDVTLAQLLVKLTEFTERCEYLSNAEKVLLAKWCHYGKDNYADFLETDLEKHSDSLSEEVKEKILGENDSEETLAEAEKALKKYDPKQDDSLRQVQEAPDTHKVEYNDPSSLSEEQRNQASQKITNMCVGITNELNEVWEQRHTTPEAKKLFEIMVRYVTKLKITGYNQERFDKHTHYWPYCLDETTLQKVNKMIEPHDIEDRKAYALAYCYSYIFNQASKKNEITKAVCLKPVDGDPGYVRFDLDKLKQDPVLYNMVHTLLGFYFGNQDASSQRVDMNAISVWRLKKKWQHFNEMGVKALSDFIEGLIEDRDMFFKPYDDVLTKFSCIKDTSIESYRYVGPSSTQEELLWIKPYETYEQTLKEVQLLNALFPPNNPFQVEERELDGKKINVIKARCSDLKKAIGNEKSQESLTAFLKRECKEVLKEHDQEVAEKIIVQERKDTLSETTYLQASEINTNNIQDVHAWGDWFKKQHLKYVPKYGIGHTSSVYLDLHIDEHALLRRILPPSSDIQVQQTAPSTTHMLTSVSTSIGNNQIMIRGVKNQPNLASIYIHFSGEKSVEACEEFISWLNSRDIAWNNGFKREFNHSISLGFTTESHCLSGICDALNVNKFGKSLK